MCVYILLFSYFRNEMNKMDELKLTGMYTVGWVENDKWFYFVTILSEDANTAKHAEHVLYDRSRGFVMGGCSENRKFVYEQSSTAVEMRVRTK